MRDSVPQPFARDTTLINATALLARTSSIDAIALFITDVAPCTVCFQVCVRCARAVSCVVCSCLCLLLSIVVSSTHGRRH